MLVFNRIYLENSTISAVTIEGRFICFAFELPYKNNQKQISCILEGIYSVIIEEHKKYGRCLRLNFVDGRDGILVHAANLTTQIKGCIVPVRYLNPFASGGIDSKIALAKCIDELERLEPNQRKIKLTSNKD